MELNMEKVANSIIKRPQAELIIPDYRYERKFFISELTKDEVESLVRLHPAWFSEIYNQRFVNNIYFDSLNLTNYLDNYPVNFKKLMKREITP